MKYLTNTAQEEELTAAVNAALAEMNLDGMSDYEKVRTIYQYVCDHVDYDDSSLGFDSSKLYRHTAYNALCKGKAVCEGYSILLYRFLKEAGFSTRIITGYGFSASHAWNIVGIDGIYYNLDCTWDGQTETTYYDYFLKNESDFIMHERGAKASTIEFINEYPMAAESWVDYSDYIEAYNMDNLSYSFTTVEEGTATSTASERPKILFFYDDTEDGTYMLEMLAGYNFPGVDFVMVDTAQRGKNDIKALAGECVNKNITFAYCTGTADKEAYEAYLEWTKDYLAFEGAGIHHSLMLYIDKNNKIQHLSEGNWDAQGDINTDIIRHNIEYYLGVKIEPEPILVESLSFSKTSVRLEPGESAQLLTYLSPANVTVKTVEFSSSDPAVASVDDTGNITALSAGTATITASAKDESGISAACEVAVNRDVTMIRLDLSEYMMKPGTTQQLEVTIVPADATNKNVTYSSSDESVATIDASGRITALSEGSTIIKVTAQDGSETYHGIHLDVGYYVEEIALSAEGVPEGENQTTLQLGEGVLLNAVVTPANARCSEVEFMSWDDSVAIVDANGYVQAVGYGETTIAVYAVDGHGAEAYWTVIVANPDDKTEDDAGPGENEGTGDDAGSGDNEGTGDDAGPGDNEGTGDDAGSGDNEGTEDDAKPGDNEGTGDDAGTGDNTDHYTGLKKENGKWIYYENGVANKKKYAFVEYGGSKFLVANGAVASKSGLAQDPKKQADWYFLSKGQVQTQYTGLAQYDGSWFYVTQGKLDTTLAGCVEYDGGLFYVGAGRIMTEVSGLVQDPGTQKWYFMADGQVQKQYTGLALYDGAWFYIVEGALAENYTGNVTYDGTLFYVVNGELAY